MIMNIYHTVKEVEKLYMYVLYSYNHNCGKIRAWLQKQAQMQECVHKNKHENSHIKIRK